MSHRKSRSLVHILLLNVWTAQRDELASLALLIAPHSPFTVKSEVAVRDVVAVGVSPVADNVVFTDELNHGSVASGPSGSTGCSGERRLEGGLLAVAEMFRPPRRGTMSFQVGTPFSSVTSRAGTKRPAGRLAEGNPTATGCPG